MSTIGYQNMLKEINNKVLNNELKYKNTIIIGDNSSGKSEILKQILKVQKYGYYLIDSVNRNFNYLKVNLADNIPDESYKNIIKQRLQENIFNLQDTFNLYGDGTGFIEQIYFNYEEKLKKLVKDFLDVQFNIIKVNDSFGSQNFELKINEEINKISNGYQAVLRMFLEIIYFAESVGTKVKNPVVVIDEINEFLSPKNEERILPFLIKEFNDFNFIVTTHSAEIIVSSIDCNVLVLHDNICEYLDGNDYNSITDTREIFEKIYNLNNKEDIDEDSIESLLRSLLNIKISNQWTQKEEDKLNNINEDDFSNAHKLLIQQIKSW